MKTKLILLVFSLIIGTCLKGQYVTVPDTNFLNWIRLNAELTGCVNGTQLDTTCTSLLSDSIVDCSWSQISNLDGIQYFKNLKILNCGDNFLDSLPTLPAHLRQFTCRANDLDGLPNLPDSIEWMDCSFNHLTVIQQLPLSLRYLDCEVDTLFSLPLLPPYLDTLICSNNHLTSLPSIPSSLIYLDCSANNIDTIPAAASLKCLFCQYGTVSVLQSLSSTLIYLYCFNNSLKGLPPLPPNLTWLLCDYNEIDTLPSMPLSLLSVTCDHNRLRWITPPFPDSLQIFNCDHNLLTEIPDIPRSVINFGCGSNNISALPALLSDSMTFFYCDSNPNISCLPFLHKIQYLNFTGTSVACLPNYGDVINSLPPISSLPLCDSNNLNGCAVYTSIEGIEEFHFSIFPNPTSSDCVLNADATNEMRTAIVYDALGQQVFPLFNNQQLTTFNFSCNGFAPGLYLVKVIDTEGRMGVIKLMKE